MSAATIRVKTTDLKPGMRLAGRRPRTIRGVNAETVRGGGEFPDYVIYTVLLEQRAHGTSQWADFQADDLHTVYVDEIPASA